MKCVIVEVNIPDLGGLLNDLKNKSFSVINVASDKRKTYIYLEDSEEKNPVPVVMEWAGKIAPIIHFNAPKKTITMPVYRRPQYMREAMEALRKNRLDGYILYIGVEPGCPETLDMAKSVSFIPCVVVENAKVLGINWNPKALIDRVFSEGSEFNIHVEEDVAVSPDALDLAEWYRTGMQGYVCLGFINCHSDPTRPLDILDTNYFTPFGWCVPRETWTNIFAPRWMCDARGWDWSVTKILSEIPVRTLHPSFSRSTHIGRSGGVHFSAEEHDRSFGSLIVSKGEYREGFRIVKS